MTVIPHSHVYEGDAVLSVVVALLIMVGLLILITWNWPKDR